MNRKSYLIGLLTLPLALASCQASKGDSSSSATSSSSSSSSSSSVVQPTADSATIRIDGAEGGQVLSPDEVTLADDLHSIEDDRFYNTQVLPSTGDVNLLVIPVLMPDYKSFAEADLPATLSQEEKQAAVRSDIEQAFFGEETAEGIHSVASFYEESSQGQLRLSGTVTDWYDASLSGITASAQVNIDATYDLVQDAVSWAFKTYNLSRRDFDSDRDGFYDGIWVIYSAEDYTRNGPMTDDQNFWAYTSWGNQSVTPNPDLNQYAYNLFGWASYDFMYDTYEDHPDAHTYIHETGHFLGLNDYYSDRSFYNPVGKVDMMDGNIGDHNAYAKMLLGWEKPYVVSGDATITLTADQENSFIVLLPDGQTVEDGVFDPFSEYILIELYSPTGVNALDREYPVAQRPLPPEKAGVRIYHIDNRRFVTRYDEIARQYVTTEAQGTELSEGEGFILPITNSVDYNQYYYDLNLDLEVFPYDEIRLIEAEGKNTFSTGGFQTARTYFGEGDTFSFAEYADCFLNLNTLDNGSTLSATITVEDLTEVH